MCILNYLFCIKQTRLFATNSLSFLPECDKIVLLDDGKLKDIGSYNDLIKNDYFIKFIGDLRSKNLEEVEYKNESKLAK
jgi:ATP-binding cassette subfamily C (CFTR/MRP) protein 1